MTPAAAFLRDLRSRGAVLRVEGDRLRGDAPRGVLTPEDRSQLVAFKPALVALLQAEAQAPAVDEVARPFGARIVSGWRRGLVCVCGGRDWVPGSGGWFNCKRCEEARDGNERE